MITDRGIWTSKSETDTHLVDVKLCECLIEIIPLSYTIIDVGCGNGGYTKAFIDAGFKCDGYDGSPLTSELTGGLCKMLDFSRPVKLSRYDTVLCLEVGEHIPAQYENIFLDNICRLANKLIIISWGIKGQPGYGHVNCRNNDYVIAKMFERGFMFSADTSMELRMVSELPWFKNTLMVFYHG